MARERLKKGIGSRMRTGIGVGALVAVAAVTATSYAHDTTGKSTLQQTLTGGDPGQGFQFLRLGPGEPYQVRDDLATALPGRAASRRSLAYSGQITDFQLADEESPARVEFLDPNGREVKGAWRPQEALVVHQVEFTIRQLNRFLESPVPQGNGERARMVNAVMTGDLADNQHRNETEWVLRLLEGGTLDPNTGSGDVSQYPPECQEAVARGDLDPSEAKNYTGVQDYDDYPPESPPGDDFYDPDEPAGIYAERGFPTYRSLMDKAQAPFRATGLRVPSYVAFGNHDGLAQGNEDAIAPFEAIGTGCKKVFPSGEPTGLPAPGDSLFDELLDPDPDETAFVPPDESRQYVDKAQFKAVFEMGGQPDGHGFAFVDPAEQEASNGAAAYYSFEPTPGVRYIVLDTLSEGGVVGVSSAGNIDDPQFQWLVDELAKAKQRGELVVVWGHHATESLVANAADEQAAQCTTNDEHGHDVNPGCDRDPRPSTPLHFGSGLIALFHQYPNVIAYVVGHSHENQIEAFKNPAGGGFWEIKSPAISDWPPQHRLIEVMDNRDGTLSIFATLLDHDGPSLAPRSGDAGRFSLAELASVGRTLSYNDPQQGPDGSEGTAGDRNVELLIPDPRLPGILDPP